MAFRYDTGSLGNVQRTPQGGIRVPAVLTRAGLFRYRNPDGSERVEYRPADEVSRADSLATLRDAPVTSLHHGLINTKNFRRVSVGMLSGEARLDGAQIVADLVIQDDETIRLIESGERREVSCGYQCRLDRTPGVFEGERYDAVQRDITYNHVALVPRGRAGRDVALRLDSDDNQISPAGPGVNMKIEIIGGVEYEVGSQAHVAAVQARNTAQAAVQTRLDAVPAIEGENATLRAKLAEMQTREDSFDARVRAAVQARIRLARTGARAGVEVREDMTDEDVMRAVVSKIHPAVDLKDKPAAFVQAAFEIALGSLPDAGDQLRQDALDATRGGPPKVEREDADDGLPPDERARRSMIKSVRSLGNRRPSGDDKR